MSIENASLTTIREIRGQYRFVIPEYQRGFAWNEGQWGDLWRDALNAARRTHADHFSGSLMLRVTSNTDVQPEVVDGQQRLTSISLLLRALDEQGLAIEFKNKAPSDLFRLFRRRQPESGTQARPIPVLLRAQHPGRRTVLRRPGGDIEQAGTSASRGGVARSLQAVRPGHESRFRRSCGVRNHQQPRKTALCPGEAQEPTHLSVLVGAGPTGRRGSGGSGARGLERHLWLAGQRRETPRRR